ncbi:hypothetical protein SAMN05444422_102372 [Halobiforma haloterrestris]|uniref:Uncharacterized protein n=1 Tax=Natronobacterium haloterrestre TaxID=148448 RepID=A0A1I1EE25_NATHA|nr:hypothetical protein [Halobiforma haloterrestris]SFB84832.1 hypothetical protein SAMN05444422_102372 [Halobiforma haloterrestris]
METAMGPWLMVATLLSGANVLLLGVLTIIWIRNYRTFGSEMTAGLAVFGVAMLLENIVAIYFFFSSGMLYADSPGVQQSVATLRAFQTVALAFLTYVTAK